MTRHYPIKSPSPSRIKRGDGANRMNEQTNTWHPVGRYKDPFATRGPGTIVESVINSPITIEELIARYNYLLSTVKRGACINCGETEQGGFVFGEGDAGPFCQPCFDRIKEVATEAKGDDVSIPRDVSEFPKPAGNK